MWFKRDLRVYDHPALCLAAGWGRVLPLYVAEPDYWALPDTSSRQWAFTAETLAGLRTDLAALGGPLIVRTGDAIEVLPRLCKQNAITRIISHQDVGNTWTRARDRRLAACVRDAGIEWKEVPLARGAQKCDDPALPAPRFQPIDGIEPGEIPPARALRLQADSCPHRQTGGRVQAGALLDSFLEHRGAGYLRSMPSPLKAERACSRLSPYLAAGVISSRSVVAASVARRATRPGGPWAANLRGFETRLVWRAPSAQSAQGMDRHAAPHLAGSPTSGALMEAWAQGQTGYPFLDACMRYLTASGWLNFKARAMLLSFATYYLGLDRSAVGNVLARRFTDYDPSIHWPQVQQHSGLSENGRLRGIDPVKQGLEHDPRGSFTRRWVPELAPVPDRFVHMPWIWPGAQSLLGRRYPEPIVDLATAAKEARAAIAPLRGETPPKTRRSRPAHLGQLALDL
ncbi:FAD-binding domain-containing protein [Pseudorhodobacter aquimaris]|uniref:FAD-binding domain-containing protein n=1 Tax=Pseudorhodobacter aquimaris TaxID=687412 RepID=UPI001E286B38|nr:FAD-binding domain-containing protein [Pseudorhodobacter aquimaris]